MDGLLKHETLSYRMVSVVFISVLGDPSNKKPYFEKYNSFIKEKFEFNIV